MSLVMDGFGRNGSRPTGLVVWGLIKGGIILPTPFFRVAAVFMEIRRVAVRRAGVR